MLLLYLSKFGLNLFPHWNFKALIAVAVKEQDQWFHPGDHLVFSLQSVAQITVYCSLQ